MSMTKEEAIAFLSRYVDNEYYTPQCQEAHRMAIEALKDQEERRWIPVTERLPDHNKSVRVYCENVTIQGGRTVHIGSCDTMNGTPFWFLRTQPGVSSYPNHEWRVTHWMPLSEPPKGE